MWIGDVRIGVEGSRSDMEGRPEPMGGPLLVRIHNLYDCLSGLGGDALHNGTGQRKDKK
jgi:hypothetical protein